MPVTIKGMHDLIIGCPFGNYLRWEGTTPTLGTYTVTRRAGFWLRLWRVLKTVRYHWDTQSWVNRLGLPNPGISSLKDASGCILSVHGTSAAEWQFLVHAAAGRNPVALEFNYSCPNVTGQPLQSLLPACELAMKYDLSIIVKLPPIRWMQSAKVLFSAGVRHLHLCNTMPSPGGGVSGKLLKQYSLWAVEEVRAAFPEITITGGGGITDTDDVQEYLAAGADKVSVASMLFNPFAWHRVPKMRDFLLLQRNLK